MYYDEDGYWYYKEQEEDPYEDALEQLSVTFDTIYHGDLLVSEIINQDNKMIVLASGCLLIADIDCGDKTDKPLGILQNFVDKNDASFLIYKTKNGLRYLQTNILYQGVNNSAINILKELQSDPKYIDLCRKRGRFMARLTPKFNNPKAAIKYFENIKKDDARKYPKVRVCREIVDEKICRKPILPVFNSVVFLHNLITQSHSCYKNYQLF